MKRHICFFICFIIVELCCDKQQSDINLEEYHFFFDSQDTIRLYYLQFLGGNANVEEYAQKMVQKFEDYDSLFENMANDSNKIYLDRQELEIVKNNSNEYKLAINGHAAHVYKFLNDSVVIRSLYDSAEIALPNNITIGSAFFGGKVKFVKEESLAFGSSKIRCVVVSWKFQGHELLIWLNPAMFIVKKILINSDGSYVVDYLDRKLLFH